MMSKYRLYPALALLVALPLALGCGGGEPAGPSTESTQTQAPPPASTGSGSISGTVSYQNGDPDVVISMDADPNCAALHSEDVFTESVVAENGALANAFVYIKSGLSPGSFPKPAGPHVLDQVGCQYQPHVSGMMVNQELIVRNSDETLHNVHAIPAKNAEFNQAQPFPGMELKRTWDQAEVMIRFKCDVHPWMSSYMGVLDHPFFAVSGADGSYSIGNVPAGTYTVEVWHETLGTKTQEVNVADGGAAEANWQYEPAAAGAASGM